MSTYLKSAAMSLLSKTVQTFLTKYLSDVDVEGVTLPSYDGSGWGVRLKNVQLREGVQLMKTMPGKAVKKRMVKRRRMRKRRIEPKEKPKPKQPSHRNGSKDKKKTLHGGTESQLNAQQGQDVASESDVEYYPLDGEKKKDAYRRSRTNSAISTSDLEIPAVTSSDYYTDDDEPIGESGAPGPVQTPKGVFSCFYNRKSRKGGLNELNDHSLHQGRYEQQLNPDTVTDSEKAETIETLNGDTEKTEPEMDDTTEVEFGEENDMYEFYEEEEEYEEEQELPMKLCLGEHGRIGMVDVRLIGKELHVMVEDAMVTLEAIPYIEKEGTEENSNDITSDENLNGDGVTKASATKGEADGASVTAPSETNKSTKTSKKEPKRDTVGDRVLADNALARLIASIPHLFLRDICIRMIVRDEPVAQTEEEADNITGGYSKPQPSSKDTMVQVGIDFLSVTSGEDILSRFQQEHASTDEDIQNMSSENDAMDLSRRSGLSHEDSVSSKPPSLLKIPTNFVDANGEHKNEYLIRHIRTGRGESGGISVQLYVPNSGLSKIVRRSTASSGDLWARQHWISSTKNLLLRCSGLDIQARIHMGTKRVDAGYSWFYGEEDGDESVEIDSMFMFGGGIDTIAPGAQLPFPPPPDPSPPTEPRMSRGNTPIKNKFESSFDDKIDASRSDIETMQQTSSSMHPGVDVHHVDANGIQSCKVPSSFHRVSRGLILTSCKDCTELPSEVSDSCWEDPPTSKVKKESSLDSSIPMPGLALQICIRDPLEINVDRNNIESIGLIKSLFTNSSTTKPKNDTKSTKDSEPNASSPDIATVPSVTDDATQTTSTSTGFFSSLLYGKPEVTIHEEVPEDSFESYMQPESISVMGIYLAETIIRIHIMREDKDDRDLSFCYWEVDTQCLTIDLQSLATPEKSFSDLKLDVGRLVWDEFKGTSKKNLVSLGVLQLRGSRPRSNSVSSMIDDHEQNKAPWPSTACALLDIPPPAESLAYKNREGHGLQLRFISTPTSAQSDLDEVSRSMIYLRLGLATVDSNWAIRSDIGTTINEIMRSLADSKKSAAPATENATENDHQNNDSDDADKSEKEAKDEFPKSRSLMSYTIQVDSGNISLPPLIQVKIPMSRFSGERSSLNGFSIESELGKVDFAYGAKVPETPKPSPLLPQIARLPESVRMHVLLCLKDLSPLEIALNVKKEKNSFRRIKSVDKAILKTAKKVSKRCAKATGKKKSSSHLTSRTSILDSANRRERILTEIMKLDDSELTNLWSVHQRYQKKLAKKLRDEAHAE